MRNHTPTSQTMYSDTDVVIVGAGPVGMTLALLLAERGRTVAVFERWGTAFPLPRAAGMSHETVRTFQSLGLLEQLLPHLNFDHDELSTSLYAPDREVLATMAFAGDGASGFPPMVGFHQPDVDGLLSEACEAHPLVGLHRGWEARTVEQGGDDAVVTLDPVDGDQPRDGDPVTARGRFVVGCDGANSVVRSLMDTGVTDTGFSSTWLVIDTLVRPGASGVDLFGHMLDHQRPATLAPAGKGRQRVEMMTLDSDDLDHIGDADSVWGLLARFDITPDKVDLARSAIYTFRGRWADSWRDGRILLAGDAAHQMPPFLGQGFNSGVRDSLALAWRIDLILSGEAAIELLDGYTTERLHHVRQIVEASVALGQLTCNTDPQAIDALVAQFRAMHDHVDTSGEDAAITQSDWQLGPGCLLPGDAAAGFVARQARVEKDGMTGLLDDLTGSGRFLLIGKDVDPMAGLSDQARSIWQQLGGRGVTIGADDFRDVDGSYAEWFQKLGATIVLVRPDFQVYGTATDTDHLNEMVINLARQLHLHETSTSTAGQLVG